MQNRVNFLPFFLVFFGLSLLLILFGRSGVFDSVASVFNKSSEPGRRVVSVLNLKSLQNQKINELNAENAKLKKESLDKKNILTENIALKSQFAISQELSQNYLPAKVIGYPGFVPGVSLPEYLIIDKGSKDGLVKGSTVVVENFLVGKIVKIYKDVSKIELILNKNSTFTAKAEGESEINGIIKGQGNEELILDNVLLTAEIKKDSMVLTKGDLNENKEGYPPDLIVGKVVSVEKKQSDLFQRASVKSQVDFKNLEYVFVIK